MNALGIVSLILQLVGAALVLAGLYRRDPAARQALRSRMTRVRSRIRRLLRLPGRHHVIEVSGESMSVSAGSAEIARSPGARSAGASTDARLEWLERAVDLLVEELDHERTARRNGDREVSQRLGVAEKRQETDRRHLEQQIDEARLPERMEWYGASLLVVGLIGSAVAAIVA